MVRIPAVDKVLECVGRDSAGTRGALVIEKVLRSKQEGAMLRLDGLPIVPCRQTVAEPGSIVEAGTRGESYAFAVQKHAGKKLEVVDER
jgi:hypothetical protein